MRAQKTVVCWHLFRGRYIRLRRVYPTKTAAETFARNLRRRWGIIATVQPVERPILIVDEVPSRDEVPW